MKHWPVLKGLLDCFNNSIEMHSSHLKHGVELFYNKHRWIFSSTGITSNTAMILRSHMRWCRDIVRLADEWMPKYLFYGELADGKCYQRKNKKGGITDWTESVHNNTRLKKWFEKEYYDRDVEWKWPLCVNVLWEIMLDFYWPQFPFANQQGMNRLNYSVYKSVQTFECCVCRRFENLTEVSKCF